MPPLMFFGSTRDIHSRYQGTSWKLAKHRRQKLDKSNAVDFPIWKFPVSIATLRRTLSPIVEPCIECASEEAKSIVGGPLAGRFGGVERPTRRNSMGQMVQ